MWWTRCWTCGDRRPTVEALDRVRAGEDDPDCLVCRDAGATGSSRATRSRSASRSSKRSSTGPLRSSAACDVLLAVGSTLSVYPAASCVPIAARSGAKVVVVNGSPTEMDLVADEVLRGQISEILPALVSPTLPA